MMMNDGNSHSLCHNDDDDLVPLVATGTIANIDTKNNSTSRSNVGREHNNDNNKNSRGCRRWMYYAASIILLIAAVFLFNVYNAPAAVNANGTVSNKEEKMANNKAAFDNPTTSGGFKAVTVTGWGKSGTKGNFSSSVPAAADPHDDDSARKADPATATRGTNGGGKDELSSSTQLAIKGLRYDRKYSYPILSPTAMEQVLNYRHGTALMVNIHITHHGGTTFCKIIGKAENVKVPHFNCMLNQDDKVKVYDNNNDTELLPDHPWTAKETPLQIALLRPHFHMVSWEFAKYPNDPNRQIAATSWENPQLLSVIVMRDPINRLLAGSGWVAGRFPKEDNRTIDDWWAFAKTNKITDNYAMRALAGPECCSGENTDVRHFNAAKALVERFTFVLDIACLDESLDALADVLGLTPDFQKQNKEAGKKRRAEKSSRERIGHDDVYDFLVRRNHYDIELYKWSKTRSLVDCSTLK